MKTKAILAILVLASAIQAQQANTQTPEQQHAEMMKRGDAGMGFSQDKTTHHFLLLKGGGAIQVNVNDPKDDATRSHIRMHLSHVAEMFSAGNFDVPMFIHDKAAMLRWVTGCQQQENAERGVQAHHHRQRGVLLDHHHQGINASRKQQSHHDQHNLQHPFSIHRALLAVTNL
jgi:hypothetical protein